MLATKSVRAAAPGRLGDVTGDIKGVDLRCLPPFTTLLVWTVNSLYRVVTISGRRVYVQGGAYFPHSTSADVDGAGTGGSDLARGWIGLGLLLQIRSDDQCVMTSPVLGIAVERPSGTVVH